MPSIAFRFVDRSGSPISLTGATVKLAAKRFLTDADSKKLFDKTATGLSANGNFTVGFAELDTSLVGTFPGELRRWASGDSLTGPPRDAYAVTVVVNPAVVRSEA